MKIDTRGIFYVLGIMFSLALFVFAIYKIAETILPKII